MGSARRRQTPPWPGAWPQGPRPSRRSLPTSLPWPAFPSLSALLADALDEAQHAQHCLLGSRVANSILGDDPSILLDLSDSANKINYRTIRAQPMADFLCRARNTSLTVGKKQKKQSVIETTLNGWLYTQLAR